MRTLRHALAITAGLAWSCLVLAQQAFPTPEKAAQAFVDALGTKQADQERLKELLGNEWRTFIPSAGGERKDVEAFLKQYHERHQIEKTSENSAALSVGNNHFTLPIPLVKGPNGWRFDTKAGGAEIRARRIGRNELDAVQSALAYHDAQMDYASVDRDGDGQGPSAPGGAYSYLIGDKMSRGFALIAWPAKYDDTGVMSFMISHEGQVFEKDLGPDGEKIALSMKSFDPDDSWKEVDTSEQ
jgi:hypothetical protein